MASALLRAARAIRERRSVVLCYHGVADSTLRDDPKFLQVRPSRLRAQIELMLGAGFEFLTVAAFAARAGGGEPPPGLAALSFDDGMEDNHSVLLPILREYALPATVYVATGFIGQPNPFMPPGSGARMMTAEELRALAGAGLELGAHTVTHPDMSKLGREDCLREMLDSREELERITGEPVRTFAYPSCMYGPEAVAAAREAGFAAAVTCQGRGSWAPHELKRSVVTGKDGMPSFLLKLAEAYQPLFESAPSRMVRVSTRRPRRVARRAAERLAPSGRRRPGR